MSEPIIMELAKIAESPAANGSIVTAGWTLSVLMVFLETALPIIMGLVTTAVGIAFFVVHLKNIKKIELETKILERQLNEDSDIPTK
jgi:hypothetical protein